MQGNQPQQGKYIIFTYRNNIVKKLASTYYDSDSGWGCMLRVGQMAIANLLHSYENMPFQTLLLLFWDNSDLPFSIQNFTQVTNKIYPHKQPFEWYNPNEMGFIIKDLLGSYVPNIHSTIFLSNSIFLSQISSTKPIFLVMIMIRIGLQEPQPIYLPVVQSLMQTKYFVFALGGTPKHAHLFLKANNQKVGYLDPHSTKKAASSEQQLRHNAHEYWSQLSWIKATKMDSSMCLVYRFKKEQKDAFWLSLQQLKDKYKQDFFIYMEKEKPEINEDDENDGIIQIQ